MVKCSDYCPSLQHDLLTSRAEEMSVVKGDGDSLERILFFPLTRGPSHVNREDDDSPDDGKKQEKRHF